MRHHVLKTIHSDGDRKRELEKTLRHALILAGSGWSAEEALHHHREGMHEPRRLGRLGQLLGLGTLLGYLIYRHPARKFAGQHLTLLPMVTTRSKSDT